MDEGKIRALSIGIAVAICAAGVISFLTSQRAPEAGRGAPIPASPALLPPGTGDPNQFQGAQPAPRQPDLPNSTTTQPDQQDAERLRQDAEQARLDEERARQDAEQARREADDERERARRAEEIERSQREEAERQREAEPPQ